MSDGDQRLGSPAAFLSTPNSFRYLAIAAALLAYLTILLGAGVTFTDTPLVCPTWPGCSPGSPVPQLGGPATLEFSHRLAAFALSLLTLALVVLAHVQKRVRPGIRRLAELSAVLVVLQALLGGVIIFTDAAFFVVVLHLGLATLLFGVLILIAAMTSFSRLPRRWQLSLLGTSTLAPETRAETEPTRTSSGSEGSRAPPSSTP